MGIASYTSVVYSQGCDIDSNDTSKFAAAIQAAQKADATVLVMGLDQTQEAEGCLRNGNVDLNAI